MSKPYTSPGRFTEILKPDNALFINGKVVVSDLGLAKFNERDTTILTQTDAVVGTMMYLAPEQSLPEGSRRADMRTDIFQLGKTLYQLITGDQPVLMDLKKLPTGLAHAVRRATQQHPNDRYQSVGELMDAVRAFQQSRDPDADPVRAFEAIIARVKESAARDRYDAEDTKRVLAILSDERVQRQGDQFLEMFDQIPPEILKVIAETEPDAFEPVLSAFIDALDRSVRGQPFSYAERVAERMSPLMAGDRTNSEIKAQALEAILISAVRLNRFAAMESFNSLLKSVKDDEDAAAVQEMLERRKREYSQVCSGVPSLQLHPTIRRLRDNLCAPSH